MPMASFLGLLWPGTVPILGVRIVFGVARRVGERSIAKPAREERFTVVEGEERHKAENFTDPVVCREGEAFTAWLAELLRAALTVHLRAGVRRRVPVAMAGFAVGCWLGRRHADRAGEPV